MGGGGGARADGYPARGRRQAQARSGHGAGGAPRGGRVKGGASVHAELHPGVTILVLPHRRTGLVVLNRIRSERGDQPGGLVRRSGTRRGGAGGESQCSGCAVLQGASSGGKGGPGCVWERSPRRREAGRQRSLAYAIRSVSGPRQSADTVQNMRTRIQDGRGTGKSRSYLREGSGPGPQAASRPSCTAAPL